LVGVNTALSEWVPTGNVVVIDAVPPVTVTGLPMGVAPSLNCTLPTADAGDTVAVNVSPVPAATGETGVTAKTVLVIAALTT
jgi:hypothetical protein